MDNEPIKRIFRPKLIFIVLGVIIAVEVIFAVRTLTKPLPPPPAKLQPISGGKIVLLSPGKSYKVGDSVFVTIRVATGGRATNGTDLVLNYDPKILEASTSGAIRPGKIYSDYPILTVDPKTGTIRISGTTSAGSKAFNGIGVFATLNLKAISAGDTTLKVDFQKDSTTDSNVVESSTTKDILEEVFNLEVNVQ